MASGEPVAIVGAGAVAQAIGRLLSLRGERIVALAARKRERAARAATFVDSSVQPVEIAAVPGLATRVLIAVSDEAIGPVALTLAEAGMRTGAALHTCGAKGPDALAPLRAAGVSCGIIHPLQTFPNPVLGVERLPHITFGLAGDRQALDWAEEIVRVLEGRALHIAAERLSWYHAGAVLASNALIGTVDAATVCLALAGVERTRALEALEPIVRASVDNVMKVGPQAALTGPIVRGDVETVAAHVRAMEEAPPSVAALYAGTARHLIHMSRERGLDDRIARSLESAIATPKGE